MLSRRAADRLELAEAATRAVRDAGAGQHGDDVARAQLLGRVAVGEALLEAELGAAVRQAVAIDPATLHVEIDRAIVTHSRLIDLGRAEAVKRLAGRRDPRFLRGLERSCAGGAGNGDQAKQDQAGDDRCLAHIPLLPLAGASYTIVARG